MSLGLAPVRSAEFSKDRAFRFLLRIVWDETKPLMNLCMLNPSEADEFRDDPTVTRGQEHAVRLGHGGLIVTNAYAFKATHPKELKKARARGVNVVGVGNDERIVEAAKQSKLVVCGWGTHIEKARSRHVLRLLRSQAKRAPHALIFTKGGEPGHPLYLPYEGCPPMEITDPNFCMECGCEVAPENGSSFCGECSCEDDGI